MSVLRLPALAALAGLLLAGCGRPADDALFPLSKGHRWTYRVTTTYDDPSLAPLQERLELVADGEQPVAGASAWRRHSSSGVAYWLRSDASGIARVASQGPLDAAPRPDPAGRYVLRRPYAVGTSWEADTTPYVLQRRNEFPHELRHLERYRTLAMTYRIEQAGQAVEVPAGRFTGCLLVQGVAGIRLYADEALAFREVPVTTREWYCPGAGLVRQERLEPSPTKFLLGGSVRLELVDWR